LLALDAIFGSDMRPLFVILGMLLRMIAAPADALLVIKKVEVRAFKLCYTSLSCRNPEAPVMLNEYVPRWASIPWIGILLESY